MKVSQRVISIEQVLGRGGCLCVEDQRCGEIQLIRDTGCELSLSRTRFASQEQRLSQRERNIDSVS